MRSSNHYARMSDEYGGQYDRSKYPNAFAHTKNPHIIESYDPHEVKAKIGEGARVSDAIGSHYRDPNYRPPRGGVPLSNHAPMPEFVSNKVKQARARDAAEKAEASARLDATFTKASSGGGPGGLDYRGDDPELYGKYYPNGYEFEGYYQGLHAGRKGESSFSGSGVHHKNFVDPYEGYRGGIDRLQQKPLPKHNDMDAGVLASMKPNGRVPPPVNNARGALERFTSRMAIQTGRGAGGGALGGDALGDVGVSKKSVRASRPSDRTMRAVVPGVQEGTYQNGPLSKGKGANYHHPSEGNIETGDVNGFVAKSSAQFDGIFDENRRSAGHRPIAQSHMGFHGGSLMGNPDAVEDGIFRRADEGPGRAAKAEWKQDAHRSSLSYHEGGLAGAEGKTHDGIFEQKGPRFGQKKITGGHVDAYGSGVDKDSGAMSWGAGASRGQGGRSTEEGEGFFAEGAHSRGGHTGKRMASSTHGAGMLVDASATDEVRVAFPKSRTTVCPYKTDTDIFLAKLQGHFRREKTRHARRFRREGRGVFLWPWDVAEAQQRRRVFRRGPAFAVFGESQCDVPGAFRRRDRRETREHASGDFRPHEEQTRGRARAVRAFPTHHVPPLRLPILVLRRDFLPLP